MTAEQVNDVVREIRERVRSRYEKQVDELPDFTLPTLDPLGHARDAAEGKSASIGTVNPRPPGVLWRRPSPHQPRTVRGWSRDGRKLDLPKCTARWRRPAAASCSAAFEEPPKTLDAR